MTGSANRETEVKKTVDIRNNEEARALFGRCDEHLRIIESGMGVRIASRGEKISISGKREAVEKSAGIFERLLFMLRRGEAIKKDQVLYSVRAMKNRSAHSAEDISLEKIEVSSKRQYVIPRTGGQKKYVEAIKRYDIVFGSGPAGTGKTYLAMAMAVNFLKQQKVSRVILTRPAVEAGESLGFLPGDLYEKVNPYLRPLYDALYDMMEPRRIQEYTDRGIIEIAPLAYMRGRTLNDSFIILDEAQNATIDQMKMFLTRLGFDSKTVITGDTTQSDLPAGRESGLEHAQRILRDVRGIKFVYFSGADVVRHPLVQDIIKAYEENK